MSRVERHAAEEAAKKGGRSRKKTENRQEPQAQERPVAKIDYAVEEKQQAAEASHQNARAGKKRKGRVTPFGRFLGFIGTVIMLAGLLACLGLTVPHFMGIQSYIVVSGSMEPAIPLGSMAYAKEVDPSTFREGDIIVFTSPETQEKGGSPIIHRVVENDRIAGAITTRGDANEQNDPEAVAYENVLGLVVKVVPKLGFAASPFSSIMGKAVLVMIIVAGFLLAEVGSHIRKKY